MMFIGLASLAATLPCWFFVMVGHDSWYHLNSWMEVARQWRFGIWYPRWAASSNWGYGDPRFLLYPPGSWMVGAALYSVLPIRFVSPAFDLMALILAGTAAFHCAREWMDRDRAAWAAVIYVLNPYYLFCLYWRSDFAELLATAFFPLVFLYSHRIGRRDARSIPLLAIVLAATWLCNPPAGVISTYAAGIVVLAGTLRNGYRVAGSGVLAVILCCGLIAFYLVPALHEQHWTQMQNVTNIREFRPDQNFLFTHVANTFRASVNARITKIAMAEFAVALLTIFLPKRWLPGQRSPWRNALVLQGLSAFLMLRPSNFLWRIVPELRYVQHPWRWLFVFSFCFAFTLALTEIRPIFRLTTGFVVSALVVVMCARCIPEYKGADAVLMSWRDKFPVAGYQGLPEHAPLTADYSKLRIPARPEVLVRPVASSASGVLTPSTVTVQYWLPEHRRVYVACSTPCDATLALEEYPAWRASVDGRPTIIRTDAAGLMVFDLGAGHHVIDVRFVRTPDRVAGALFSLLTLLVTCVLAFKLPA